MFSKASGATALPSLDKLKVLSSLFLHFSLSRSQGFAGRSDDGINPRDQ
jgi:hypothetical protein